MIEPQTIIEGLKTSQLFHGLDEDELTQFFTHATLRTFPKKVLLFFQDDPIQYLYILLNGKVKFYKANSQGKEFIIDIKRAGDAFPLENIFWDNIYSVYGEFIEDAEVLMVPRAKFKQMIYHNNKICINTMQTLSKTALELQERLGEKTHYSLLDQILSLLLRLSNKHSDDAIGDFQVLDVFISNNDIADMVGTRRETISRILKELIDKEMVMYDDKHHMMIHAKKIKSLLSKGKSPQVH